MTSVAVVGTGMLGAPFADALAVAGRDVWVYDRDTAHAKSVAHARVGSSLEAVASRAEVIVCCVDGPDHALDVSLGVERIGGAIAVARPDAVYVELTTMSVSAIREEADACAARGLAFVECPVSGRSPRLAAYAAGNEEAVDIALDALAPAIDKAYRFSSIGHATVVKLVNQFLTYANLMIAVEGAALAVAAGVDPNLFVAAVGSGAGASRSLDLLGDVLEHGAGHYGTTESIRRDLDLVADLAAEHGKYSASLVALRDQFAAAIARGDAEAPFPIVFADELEVTR